MAVLISWAASLWKGGAKYRQCTWYRKDINFLGCWCHQWIPSQNLWHGKIVETTMSDAWATHIVLGCTCTIRYLNNCNDLQPRSETSVDLRSRWPKFGSCIRYSKHWLDIGVPHSPNLDSFANPDRYFTPSSWTAVPPSMRIYKGTRRTAATEISPLMSL